MMQQENFVTIEQFAKEIGLSRSQVFRRVQKGLIKAQKIGNLYLIPIGELHKITGEISNEDRQSISAGIKKTLQDYGSVIKDLGDE